MSVITTIMARRLAAVALSFAISTAVPFLLKDKPVLKYIAGRALPVIVDRALEKHNLPKLDTNPADSTT